MEYFINKLKKLCDTENHSFLDGKSISVVKFGIKTRKNNLPDNKLDLFKTLVGYYSKRTNFWFLKVAIIILLLILREFKHFPDSYYLELNSASFIEKTRAPDKFLLTFAFSHFKNSFELQARVTLFNWAEQEDRLECRTLRKGF